MTVADGCYIEADADEVVSELRAQLNTNELAMFGVDGCQRSRHRRRAN